MSEQQPDVEALTKTPEAAKAPATEKDVKEVPTANETAPRAPTTAAASKPAPASMEDAPDPEEDDLDDLDDMLDEFNKAETKPKAAEPAAAAAPKVVPSEENHGFGDMNELSEEDFAKHLQEGMAELLGGMDGNPQLAAEFEAMMKNLTTGGAGGLEDLLGAPPAAAETPKASGSAAPKAAAAPKTEENFQDTIKKTMEKIQASGAQATAAAQEESTDDILAELMKQMSAGGLDGEGGEEDFSKMLLGMMEQLTNKEILYTPMKELTEKYPEWMEKNASKTPKDDLERYRRIEKIVKEIVAKFEEKTYSDTNVADREYIVERMQLMQAAGSPPPDLVGDMASAQEAFGAPDESCAQQ